MKNQYTTYVKLLIVILVLWQIPGNAQQDANYTQYFYNTMAVNPAYAGSRGSLAVNLLYRSQWLGLDGSPETQTLNIHAPTSERVGLGLSVVNDNIGNGTSQETNFAGVFSYTLPMGDYDKLAFGLRAGGNILNIDFFKLRNLSEGVPADLQNVDNRFDFNFGLGFYYYNEKFYAGLSVPNFLSNQYFSANSDVFLAEERPHLNFITGYVFELSPRTLFKPATLVRAVSGAPISVDISANFLFDRSFRLGASYRLGSSISALFGLNVSREFLIGIAYDRDAFDLGDIGLSDGSFELFLRYEFMNKKTLATPRFF
jgi:type IX secretion system PorP/SprF family membrane protein